MLGVHEATASRRLTRIHGDIRKRVESILIKEQGWTRSEAERSLSNAALHLEADVEMLVTESAAGAGRAQPGD